MNARKGHLVHKDGSAGQALAVDHREHKRILTGIARCGKPKADGTLCNSRLRATIDYRYGHHRYECPARSGGGCGGTVRHGPRVDEVVTEAVLAKLEQRQAIVADSRPWTGEVEFQRSQQKLTTLTDQWQQDRISDALYSANVEKLEQRIREPQNERNRHMATIQRSALDTANIRQRWFTLQKKAAST